MNIKFLILIVIVFGAIFYFIGQGVTGMWKQIIQFLCGAIIVVALVLFLLGLF